MAAILSNRTLQFFNNETVFNLELKKTRFLPQGRFTAESIVDTGTGEEIEAVQETNIDFIRYISGLARYSKKNSDGSESVGTLDKLFPERVSVVAPQGTGRAAFIRFDEEFQKEYRLPFYKITFTDYEGNTPEDLNSLTLNSIQNANFYFRNLDWAKVFYSPAVLLEFLERGDLNGDLYNQVPDAVSLQDAPSSFFSEVVERGESGVISLKDFMFKVQSTLKIYGARQLLFKQKPGIANNYANLREGEGLFRETASSPSALFSDLNIKTLAQLSETQVRKEKNSNLEAVSSLKFSVGETYNFLSREYEFGDRAPSSRTYTAFTDPLLPSSYNYSTIKYLESLKDSFLRFSEEASTITEKVNELKKELFFGPFDLEPYPTTRNAQTGDLTRDLYDRFGVSIKDLSTIEYLRALGDQEKDTKRRFVLIDTLISNNFTFETLFPFGNKIKIVDLPTNSFKILNLLTKYNLETEILLNLINGVATPDSEITSTRQNLFTADYFTGRETTTSIKQVKEFDFANIFNETTQNFFIETPKNKVSLLNPRSRSLREGRIGRFNNLYTTPYIPGVNFLNSIAQIEPFEFLEQLQAVFKQASNKSLADLKDIFLSRKNNYFEIFAYKVSKRNLTTQDQQHFFIFNRPEEIVEFFDTQVKPEQEYSYNLSALTFVLENEYQYDTPDVDYGINVNVNATDSLYLSAKIENNQKLKIIELPLVEELSTISDAPPVRPSVEFYPLKDFNDRINIRLSSINATNFELPIVIEDSDNLLFNKIKKSQKLQVGDKVRFHSDETPAAFEVFRVDFKPQSITDFVSGKRIVKSITASNRNTDGTMFQDRILTNTDYYYIFRTLDFHGNISNPTEIFKFTLIDNEGALQPLLKTISLEEMFGTLKNNGTFSQKKKNQNYREARRFLKIRPSFEEIIFARNQFRGKSSKDISSVKIGRGETVNDSQIVNQKYALELKSKKTGKSIFLEFTYSLNNANIQTLETREKIEDTVTDQDIIDSIQRRNLE
jgi:hypothetical protein